MNRQENTTLTVCSGRKVDATDLGCWADGGFGHDHVREVLSVLLADKGGPADLIAELIEDPSDDYSEEDVAIEWLNDHACEDGVHFEMDCGDLILFADEEEDDEPEIEDPDVVRPEPEDYVISSCGPLGSQTSVSQIEGECLGIFMSEADAEKFICERMERYQFWPNVWFQDDHGGMTIRTIDPNQDASREES